LINTDLHDVMKAVVGRLSADDILAISAYVASREP
jgi:cytochrome c553